MEFLNSIINTATVADKDLFYRLRQKSSQTRYRCGIFLFTVTVAKQNH